MNSQHKLRLASVSDIDALLPLFRAYQEHYRQLTSATEDKTRAFLFDIVSGPERGFAVMAEVDFRVVGFATGYVTVSGVLAERMIHLGDLYVDGEFRRRGIATTLVDAVVEQARLREIALVRWLSLASNERLNQWYQSLGATSGEFRLFLKTTTKQADQTS